MNQTFRFSRTVRGMAVALPLAALIGCAGPGTQPPAADAATATAAEAGGAPLPVVAAAAPESPSTSMPSGATATPEPVLQPAEPQADAAPTPPAETAAEEEGTAAEPATVSAESAPPQQRDLYFASGESRVQAPDVALVEAHAAWLAAHPDARIRVEGHSDRQGSAQYNQELSLRRAREVAQMLIANGAGKDQIEVAGLGEQAPTADPGDLQANRRVELAYPEAGDSGQLLSRK